MSERNRFLVSYILDNDPATTEVSTDRETLTPEEALELLAAQNPALKTDKLSNVQVQGLQARDADHRDPGHNLQHGDL
jgi:hypothetical protein